MTFSSAIKNSLNQAALQKYPARILPDAGKTRANIAELPLLWCARRIDLQGKENLWARQLSDLRMFILNVMSLARERAFTVTHWVHGNWSTKPFTVSTKPLMTNVSIAAWL